MRSSLRGIGRRGYASEHTEKKSSDLPWLIGSVAVTVPAATWLWSQGPTKSDHGHDSHAEEVTPAPAEGSEEESKDEEEDKEEPKEEESSDDSKEESSEDSDKDSESTKEEDKKSAPEKDGTAVSEAKGEKDAQSDVSGASNPYMGSDEKSKKPEGPPATARIKGTVDSSRPTEGKKKTDDSE